MKRSHFTSEQIVFALRQAKSGTPVAEICRVLQCHRSVYDYESRKDEQAVLRMRIKDIAHARAER